MTDSPSITIFYSWQSDLPNAWNRGFIEKALEMAVKGLERDEQLTIVPRIDSDTKDTPGAPDIIATILSKIERAAVFVGDVSVVGSAGPKNRKMPNPNVLIELGYALSALGPERVLMVANTEHGTAEELPFDLRGRIAATYHVNGETDDKSAIRRNLAKTLERKLKIILQHADAEVGVAPTELEVLTASIENGERRVPRLLRRFMERFVLEVEAINPAYDSDALKASEQLIAAIDQSAPLVLEFLHVAEVLAEVADNDMVLSWFTHFGRLVERFRAQPQQPYSPQLFKFVAHEVVVGLAAMLIRHKRWEALASICTSEIYASNARQGSGANVDLDWVNQHRV